MLLHFSLFTVFRSQLLDAHSLNYVSLGTRSIDFWQFATLAIIFGPFLSSSSLPLLSLFMLFCLQQCQPFDKIHSLSTTFYTRNILVSFCWSNFMLLPSLFKIMPAKIHWFLTQATKHSTWFTFPTALWTIKRHSQNSNGIMWIFELLKIWVIGGVGHFNSVGGRSWS